MAVNRLVVAETGRFPELGRMFYEAGPSRGEVRFAEYAERAMAANQIRRDDPVMVGRRLKDLILSDFHHRQLWGVLGDVTPEWIEAHVAQSVDIFLLAFGVRTP